MIKIVAPNMALKVIDRAIQVLGGKGVGNDTPLAHFFAAARMLRLADGPDEVHMSQLGKSVIKKYT
jgi:acyl-CoA dehydrogenase